MDKNILEDKSWSVIKISDTGIGISRDNLDIIFEEFRQMSEGLARKFEGTGLGLTLAKKLADLMDGKITVESEFGKGSIFTIMFKSITHTSNKNNNKERFESEPGSKFPEMTEDKIFTGRRILAVDDDFIARNLLRLWLKDMYKMEFAVNGESAIQMAMNNNYDAVLMDMNLGNGFNGLDVTQKIKAMANYQNVPIIAVTAYAMDRDRIKFLNNGCAYYLSKPFNKNTIIELLNRALNVEVS
ncbi:MAG: response regulator [Ignavibacteriaceae bacterium]